MRFEDKEAQPSLAPTSRPEEETDDGAGLTIGDIIRMVLSQKWFILACTIICIVIAAVYASTVTPIYQAAATLRIDPSRASSLGLNDLLSGGGVADPDSVMKTEIAILQSDAVAVDTLNSLTDEEFKSFSGMDKRSATIPQKAIRLNLDQESLLSLYKRSLSAKQLEGTQLVAVSFLSPKPDVAANMVNKVMQAYIRQSFDSRYGSVNQVTTWLSTEMDSLRDRATEAQRKLAAFQEKNSILGADAANNTTIDRLRLLNSRLAEVQADRIVKEAQMRAAMAGDPAVLAAMFPNPDLSSLEAQQGTLYAQYAQMSSKFGANYPPLADLKAQSQKIDGEVARQVNTVRNRLQQDYSAAKATEQMLQGQYNDQAEKAYALNRQQAEYAVLQAEGSSSRDLYDTLEYKLQQAGVDAGLNGVNTMLVDSAREPKRPIAPKKTQIWAFGLILGLFTGIGIAFVRESVRDFVRGPEQVQRATHHHILAMIPHLIPQVKDQEGSSLVRTMQLLVAANDPQSRGAEAYRTLRNSILLSSMNRTIKTMLITSTLPGEGKSNTASNFAVVLAQRGMRVLLLDGDLRRPTLNLRFAVPNAIGLCELLLGEITEAPYLNPLKSLPNLFLLPAGKRTSLPSEALASEKFRSILNDLETQFDYVVIDSAPVLAVSDTLPMASWVDTVILVTRYNVTPVRALKRALAELKRAGADVAGTVINDVAQTDAKYGGYDYGYGDYYK